MKKLTIGIIGTGRMGMVLGRLFDRNDTFVVRYASTTQSTNRSTIFPIEEVILSDIVFLAIPISAIAPFLRSIALKFGNNRPLIIDICSVKIKPAEWLSTLLPKKIDCIASHPMFGPYSTKQGTTFQDLPWIMSPIRVKNRKRYKDLCSFLKTQGIGIFEMSPKEHDQIMSRSQAISFLFGMIGHDLDLKKNLFDTKGFSCILENQGIVESDSRELGVDILRFNPYGKIKLTQIQKILSSIQTELEIADQNMVS